MVDLVTLNTNLPGYGDFAKGMAMQNELAKGQLEYQKMKDEYEAQKGLRALFAQNPNASFSEVSQYSPQLAAELMKAQQEGEKRVAETKKTQREISNLEAQEVANTLGPIAEEAIATGNIQEYNKKMGMAYSEFQKQGIPLMANFSPETHPPESTLRASVARGYKSPIMENLQAQQRQQMLNQVPPPYTAEQYRGSVRPNPVTGAPEYMPGIVGQQQPMMQQQPIPQNLGPETRATVEDLPLLQQAYDAEPDANRRFQIGKMINEIRMSGGASNPSQLPLAGSTDIAAEKGKIAGAEKAAQISAEEEASDRKAMDAYFRSKPPEQVRDLIKESLAGDVETGIARLAKLFGVSVPGGAPTAALEVITQQLASTSPFPPGSQSDVEYKARLKKIGDPASNEPIENRLMALDEFYRDQESFVGQKYNPKSVEDILDKRKEGYISEDTARKLYKRLKSGEK